MPVRTTGRTLNAGAAAYRWPPERYVPDNGCTQKNNDYTYSDALVRSDVVKMICTPASAPSSPFGVVP